MKRNLLFAVLAACVGIGLFSCQPKEETQSKELPMFCTWYTYNEAEDFDSICRSFSELGIDGIVLKAGVEPEVFAFGVAQGKVGP